MGRTALEMTATELRAYRPAAHYDPEAMATRWVEAWEVARAAAEMLRREFSATRVVAFGSLVHRDWFTRWSDIDLAAWSIPPELFFRAVAAVIGFSAEFNVDLVPPDDVRPSIRRAIELEGVDL